MSSVSLNVRIKLAWPPEVSRDFSEKGISFCPTIRRRANPTFPAGDPCYLRLTPGSSDILSGPRWLDINIKLRQWRAAERLSWQEGC